MSKLYAVAISQADQAIDLQIVEADNKVEAIWEHDAVDTKEYNVEGSLIELLNAVNSDRSRDAKYKEVRSFLAEHNILVTVTKICD